MKRSRNAESLLEQYRRASLPSAEARARMLREVVARAAAGDVPKVPSVSDPELTVQRLAGSAAAGGGTSAFVVAVTVASAALVLTAAAWLWRARDVRSAQVAQTHAAANVRENRAAPARSEAARGRSVRAHGSPAPEGAYAQQALDLHAMLPQQKVSAAPARAFRAPRAPSSRSQVEAPARASDRSEEDAARAAPIAPAGEAPAVGVVPARPSLPADLPSVAVRMQLEEELRLLRAAYEALRESRPARALDALAEHAQRFPSGDLAEPRQVARIMALCQSGRRDLARAEAARFLELSPRSPHAARVRSLCK